MSNGNLETSIELLKNYFFNNSILRDTTLKQKIDSSDRKILVPSDSLISLF